VKHTQPVVVSKLDAVLLTSTTGTDSPAATNAFPSEQISAGKLAGNTK